MHRLVWQIWRNRHLWRFSTWFTSVRRLYSAQGFLVAAFNTILGFLRKLYSSREGHLAWCSRTLSETHGVIRCKCLTEVDSVTLCIGLRGTWRCEETHCQTFSYSFRGLTDFFFCEDLHGENIVVWILEQRRWYIEKYKRESRQERERIVWNWIKHWEEPFRV